jgi:hypothetical protein
MTYILNPLCDLAFPFTRINTFAKVNIYIIEELVLKQCSKFYASGGNIAKLKKITGLPKTWG